MEPVIPSILDTDHYKITMGQVVFNQFSNIRVRYRFFNRGKTPFPAGFAAALQDQIHKMADLRLNSEEANWYGKAARYLKPTYLEWLQGYRYDPEDVTVAQDGGDLRIEIEGLWYRTIFWEVPLMSIVSELFFRMSNIRPDAAWEDRLKLKSDRMAEAGVHWVDFGSRRRFSLVVQDRVNAHMKQFKGLFLGCSNPYICKRQDLVPVGTYAHEGPMAMQSLHGPKLCNRIWMDTWVREYRGDLGIALTDTVTTPIFLQDFDLYYSKLFDGVRIDSGDASAVAEMMLAHYEERKIDARSKRIIFSDSLNDTKAIELHRQFEGRCMMQAGIGTFLTNDCGARPLNMVIKLVAANFGSGFVETVKLSDDVGKHTGGAPVVELLQRELGLLPL